MYNNKLNTSTFNSETQELLDSKPVEVGIHGTRVYKLAGGEVFKKQIDKHILSNGILNNKKGHGVELFYYYLLQEMGFGPKVNVGRDSKNKRYILTDGVPNFLSTREILSAPEMKNLNSTEKNNMLSQLAKLELLARLMKLSDITFNLENTGFEVRNNKLVRPKIIDFQTSPHTYNEYPFGILLTSNVRHLQLPTRNYAVYPLLKGCGLEKEDLKPFQEDALKEMFGVQKYKEVSKFTEAILKAKAKTLSTEERPEAKREINVAITSFMTKGNLNRFDIIEHVGKTINPNIITEIKEVLTKNESKKVNVFNVSPSPSRRGSFSEEVNPLRLPPIHKGH